VAVAEKASAVEMAAAGLAVVATKAAATVAARVAVAVAAAAARAPASHKERAAGRGGAFQGGRGRPQSFTRLQLTSDLCFAPSPMKRIELS
jgi:Spy/CpxP family protein refolding chaperone